MYRFIALQVSEGHAVLALMLYCLVLSETFLAYPVSVAEQVLSDTIEHFLDIYLIIKFNELFKAAFEYLFDEWHYFLCVYGQFR